MLKRESSLNLKDFRIKPRENSYDFQRKLSKIPIPMSKKRSPSSHILKVTKIGTKRLIPKELEQQLKDLISKFTITKLSVT